MSLTLTRGLWLWTGLLGLGLVLAVFPMSGLARVLVALAICILVVLCWLFAGHRARRQRQTLVLADGCSLPAADYRLPVIAVCGDGLSSLFGEVPDDRLALRVTEQGCYLRISRPDRLFATLDAVLANRPHWGGQLSVLYIVNPAMRDDQAQLAGEVHSFRQQVARVRRVGMSLPLLLGCYLQSTQGGGPWFTWEAGHEGLSVRDSAGSFSLTQWQLRPEDWPTRAARLRTSVQVRSLMDWLTNSVLPRLVSRDSQSPPCPAMACALALVPSLPELRPDNLWSAWLRERTALDELPLSDTAARVPLPFPDPLLPLLPRQSEITPVRRSILKAIWLFVLAGVLGLCSSAWQNLLLTRQLGDDLSRYQAIPQPATREQPEYRQKEEAVAVLRADAAQLDRYYRQGEPMRLGLGLYIGERFRPPILAALAAHRVPAPAQTVAKIPDPVRLDSLSLFASGSAELKPGSTKVLVNALVDIKAQPGWLIVIAGHTDATGDDARNLALSRARAGAVRDWMQKMGDLPDSCFAVQGHGAAQPIASNDTPAGRAANRRVDIRLVPEAGACVPTARVSEGQTRSPRYQATLSSQ